jgi:membrane-associated protein
MDSILQLFGFENMRELVIWAGYIGLAVIVFAETGVLAGFFLPGDSLLVTAGIFAAEGSLNILYLNLLLIPIAILGDAVGYWFGAKAGPRLFVRDDSRFFKKRHLLRTQEFYNKHGGKTIVLARFMPIVRTFAPIVAGAAQMPYRRFVIFNIAGAMGWILSMTLLGYFLGQSPIVSKHIEIVIVLVVLASISPGLFVAARAWWRTRKARVAVSAPVKEPE